MAYKIDLGFDDSFDYEKELKRTDISDSYRKTLETELQKRNDYEATKPKITNPVAPKPAQTITLGDDYTLLDHTGKTITTSETNKAMSTTQAILDKINSGKTSYSDALKGIIGKIQGRESFAYDFNSDPLFQQALNSSMMSGQVAMQDTMGQASALTGGYGSTYATTAANNVYNQYVQGAYNQIPDFYNMALQQYQMEGDELYRQYAMLSEQDSTEFARLMDTYNLNFNNAAYLDERDYKRYLDSVSNARYDTEWEHKLEREGVEDTRYDESVEYEKEQDDKNWKLTYEQWKYQQEQDAKSEEDFIKQNDWNGDGKVDVNDYYASPEYKQIEYQKEQDYIKNQQYINENDWNGDRKVDVNDSMYAAEWESQNSGDDTKPYSLSNAEITKLEEIWKNTGSIDAVYDYLELIGKSPETPEEVAIVEKIYSKDSTSVAGDDTINWRKATFEKTTDTFNWFGGEDGDDIITVDGRAYRMDELEEAMRDYGMTEAEIEKILNEVGKLKKDETYKYS